MPPPRRPPRQGRADRRAPARPRADAAQALLHRRPYAGEAVTVFCLVFALAVVAQGLAPPGVTWDETFYIYYGDAHLRWFTSLGRDSFTRAGLERHWRVGSEHPPLFTLAIGLAHRVLEGEGPAGDLHQSFENVGQPPPLPPGERAGVRGGTALAPRTTPSPYPLPERERDLPQARAPARALRAGGPAPHQDAQPAGTINPIAARGASVIQYALLAMGVFVFVAGRWGRWAGRLAAVCLVAMPRLFAHGQVAAGDLPMALTWFVAVWAFVRAVERPGIRREVLAGAAFGAALLTKMNALFLPIILTPWALAVYRRRALRPLFITYALGLALFVLGWPWMWIDTLSHLRAYLRGGTELPQGTKRARILVYYFGRPQRDVEVPWHYPVVMSLCTVPVGVLLSAGLGAARGLRRAGRRALAALLLANLAVPLAIFALPGVPVYDGVRLFLHVFPFVACLAGVGAVEILRSAVARGIAQRTAQGMVLALAGLQVVPVLGTAPFGMSYYNLLVGGPGGAERLGFEATYWGDAMDQKLLNDLAARVPPASRVAIFPVPTDAILPYYHDQLERRGLTPVAYQAPEGGAPSFDFLIVICRKAYFDRFVWHLFEKATPLVERRLKFLGSVPLCQVYDIRGWKGSTVGGSAR